MGCILVRDVAKFKMTARPPRMLTETRGREVKRITSEPFGENAWHSCRSNCQNPPQRVRFRPLGALDHTSFTMRESSGLTQLEGNVNFNRPGYRVLARWARSMVGAFVIAI